MLDILITVVYSSFTAVLCTCIIVRLPEKVAVGECKIFSLSLNHFSFICITINQQLRDFYVIVFTAKD